MIPKKIHYCWFGGKELDEKSKACIASWKKFLPGYEIIEWNEKNFDLNQHDFVREAYDQKKYAFVTDYVRLFVLYHYGGIYMDTDVEVVKSLDDLLINKAFTGVERGEYCITGTLGAEQYHPWVEKLLKYYDGRSFFLENGELDTTTNTVIITTITKESYGWKEGNKLSKLDDGIVIYPFDFLCAKNGMTNKYLITDNTYTIHHFNGSWETNSKKLLKNYVRLIRRIFFNKKYKI
ncbi:glycosyltransferase family 32 protein [Lysinibacillus sp. Ag94]|uniref:glycosyltransferase family 32 protein n=1 Tax=Lysinibacillus sp. Ag94 TaxID=2936682 RepID=UPI00200EDCC3|nr:glycosyltransferase [Lysinibacillus sp. Ag94]UPW83708.1 glycosyl transferase [Lysinibacillus sp. Ag94]